MEAFTCGYLSWVMIVGLALTYTAGWWWADSVAALGLVPFIIKEAREAIRGECFCGCVADFD
jgi:divalent metal cation (Fe/Co/Zn/Cd) transporter